MWRFLMYQPAVSVFLFPERESASFRLFHYLVIQWEYNKSVSHWMKKKYRKFLDIPLHYKYVFHHYSYNHHSIWQMVLKQ